MEAARSRFDARPGASPAAALGADGPAIALQHDGLESLALQP